MCMGTIWRRNIAKNFNQLSIWCTNVTDDRPIDSGAVLTNRHTGHVPIFNISEGPQVAVSDANFSNYDFCFSVIDMAVQDHNNRQSLSGAACSK